MNSILKVVDAQYVRDYILRLVVRVGSFLFFAFWLMRQKGICDKLQNMNYFRNFTLDPFSVDWSNEIGFAPEYLYELGKAPKP